MRTPSKEKARGYDIVVWVDNDGDVVTKSYTDAGERMLKSMVPDYRPGLIAQIHCDPEEFMSEVPKGLSVGMVNDTSKKLVPMPRIRLH